MIKILFVTIFLTINIYADISQHIQNNIKQLEEDSYFSIADEQIYSRDILLTIYAQYSAKRIWKDEHLYQLYSYLSLASQNGLNPDDYHVYAIKKLLQEEVDDNSLDELFAKIDILATDGFITYLDHIKNGKINPKKLNDDWNIKNRYELGAHTAELFHNLHFQTKKHLDFSKGEPEHFIYQNTKKALKKYQHIVDNGGWGKILNNIQLNFGIENEPIVKLRHRLAISGDLAEDLDNNSSLFDKDVKTAIKHFQGRHGLSEDGMLGKNTLKALNISAQDKVDKLKINLERTRWVLENLHEEFIVVNIAGYLLYYVKGEEVEYKTRVIVGKVMHETPIFTAKLKYLVYNPTWTVPHSIAVNEMLAKAKRDPLYLDKKNLELLDRKYKIVDHSKVNFKILDKNNFPYVFRQRAGSANALGGVKFILPNKHSIYLHDTPAKFIFKQNARAFSHGCIRVNEPFKLAEFVLNKQNLYKKKNIDKIIDSKKTKWLKLHNELDVLLMYWTAATDIDNTTYFYKDIYSRDDKLLKALQTPLRESR